jgi:RNA polymerase sigma factor (sigma-70 family)
LLFLLPEEEPMSDLTEKVLAWQRTREGLDELMRELAVRAYRYPRRKMGWDEDACGDFYLFIHPRLLRLVDRFRDQGKPFESYLFTVLAWQLRNFARDRRQAERKWNVALRIDAGDGFAPPAPPVSDGCVRAGVLSGCLERLVVSAADRRNFLFLVLKCARTIPEEKLASFAATAGIDGQRLRELAGALREARAGREKRLETFRRRRNRAFAAERLLQEELRTETDPRERRVREEALERVRRRMRLAMQRMARVGLSPTNRQIAALLGVPKGTVDSGLYWLKKKLGSVYDPDVHRTA